MIARPYHIDYPDSESSDYHIWAKDQDSNSILIRVQGYKQRIFLEMPEHIVDNGILKKVRWGGGDQPSDREVSTAFKIHKSISQRIRFCDRTKNPQNLPCRFSPSHLAYRHTLYHFDDKKKPFLALYFHNLSALRNAVKRIKSENGIIIMNGERLTKRKIYNLKVHEDKVLPIRKLLSSTGIKHASWFEFDGNLITNEDDKIATVTEYTTHWRSLSLSETDYGVPTESVLSFDIECYSDNDNIFTDKSHPNHECYMITAVYAEGGEIIHNYGIVMGECDDINDDDTTLIYVDRERDLILEYMRIVRETDPDIITGYNIFEYDNSYIWTRLHFDGGDPPVLGRLKGVRATLYHKEWSSSAYAFNDINMITAPGRIYFDMLNVVKRLFPRENSHSLKNICKKLLPDIDGKIDLSYTEMFRIYEMMDRAMNPMNGIRKDKHVTEARSRMTEVMVYCIKDSELPIRLMTILNTWIASLEGSTVMGVNMQLLDTGGQQRRSVSIIYDEVYKKGIVYNNIPATKGLTFGGGKVADPITGLHSNVVLIDFSSLYPTIISSMNICYTTFINDVMWERIKEEQVRIVNMEGEEVILSVDDCVIIPVDYVNEYKCTIPLAKYEEIESDPNKYYVVDDKEIDSQYVTNVKYSKDENENAVVSIEFEIPGTYEYRYLKAYIRKGILPELVDRLCAERNKIRARQKDCDKGTLEWTILEMMQLALKISCNSMYGLLGVKKGMLPLIEAALSITARGRDMITQVAECAEEEFGATVIYGDTDSIMVTMPVCEDQDYDTCMYHANQLAKRTTELFPPPVNMDVDGIYERFLAIKKKKYVGLDMKPPGQERNRKIIPSDLYFKGVMAARRDNCKWAVNIYNNMLADVFNGEDFIDIQEKIFESCQFLLDYKVVYEDLIITKKMGENYKATSTAPMKKFASKMEEMGRPIQPGTRVQYLVTQLEGQYRMVEKDDRVIRRTGIDYKQGERMVTREMFEVGDHEVDIPYYLGFPTTAIDQVIEVLIDTNTVSQLGYLEIGCQKILYPNTPMAYINRLYQYGRSIPSSLDELVELRNTRLQMYQNKMKKKPLSINQSKLYEELMQCSN